MKLENKNDKALEVSIKIVSEDRVSHSTESAIIFLREQCFPEVFQNRTYFKQLPHGRILARDGADLVGHAGYDLRIMRLDNRPMRVLGIIDLCVSANHRRRGIGAALLRAAIDHAQEARAEAILLVTQNPAYYTRFGFISVNTAHVTWLGIEDRQSVGLLSETLDGALMLRIEDQTQPPQTKIDMLGYMY